VGRGYPSVTTSRPFAPGVSSMSGRAGDGECPVRIVAFALSWSPRGGWCPSRTERGSAIRQAGSSDRLSRSASRPIDDVPGPCGPHVTGI
jgi:hypothetical protein